MADEEEKPDDVSSMMEELWGPRSEAPPGVTIATPRRDGREPPRDTEARVPAASASAFAVRQAELIEQTRYEVEAVRAGLDVARAQLGGVRDQALAAADARVAGAEARLLGRLDEIAAGMAQAVERSAVGDELLARLEVVERETSERSSALEQRFVAELQRLVQAVEDVKAQSLTVSDLDSVRTEAGAGVAALAASVDAAVSRLGSMEERLADEMARPAPSSEHDHADVATLRSELATLSAGEQNLTGAQEDLTRSVEGLAEKVSRSSAEAAADAEALRARLDLVEREASGTRVALEERLRAELEGVARAVEGIKAGSVTLADLDSVRSDVGARLEADVAPMLQAQRRELEHTFDSRIGVLGERLQELQAALDTQAAQVAATLKSQRKEQTALRKGLAKVQPPTTVLEGSDAGRLQDLEEHAKQTDHEVSELNELHAALDMGLGSLRSEIAELRAALRKMSDDQAELLDRLETLATPKVVPAQRPTRRVGRKSG